MGKLSTVQSRLAKASSICVLTGAGISADSGVPTFRGKDGLWRNFRAEELATPEAFSRDPPVPIAILPYCRDCGGMLRPHIVWFGEPLDPVDMRRSMEALSACDMLLVIGTSEIVQPAASFVYIARRGGAYVVEVNLEETPNSHLVDEALTGRASEVVPLLVNSD